VIPAYVRHGEGWRDAIVFHKQLTQQNPD